MSLKNTHPSYAELATEWQKCRDCYEGEKKIKSRGETYLPATAGMRLDGMNTNQDGYASYQAYKTRAVYHNFYSDSIETGIGLLSLKDAAIKVPASMESMLKKISPFGETAQEFLLRVYIEQMKVGRIGILADVVPGSTVEVPPYLVTYVAETITNWEDKLNDRGTSSLDFVVLNETSEENAGDFKWAIKEKYRVLKMIDGSYHFGEFDDAEYFEGNMKQASYSGRILDEIPFVFVNSKDLTPEPSYPPLTTLANICLTIYRGEADYRNSLYLQGQDTLVIIGSRHRSIEDSVAHDDALRVGAGAKIEIEIGGDAKYIGVSSSGLAEMGQSIENDKKIAESLSGRFLSDKNGVESEGAIKARRGSQTATLNQIAIMGAKALERILKICAKWMGANPDEVSVTANLEFTEIEFGSDDIIKLMAARTAGVPISLKTIHDRMREKRITKLTFEEELDEMDNEEDINPPLTKGRGEKTEGKGEQ